MGQAISRRVAAAAAVSRLDSHAANHLAPWSRARCDWTCKRAASFPANQHWLVDADGDKLWMLNVVSGYETVVKMDLPWPLIPTDRREMESKDEGFANGRRTRVLCCFQGLLLVGLGRKYCNSLVLGDPLLNKWIKLPRPGWPGGFDSAGFLALAAFCPDTRTLMVCSDGAGWTATLDLASARVQWTLDPYGRGPGAVGSPQSHACCLDGVFYCTFVTFPFERDGAESITLHDERACAIACYDPAGARQWQIVKEVWVAPETFDPIFLAQTSHGKLFVYMTPATADDDGFYHLFEATRVQGSNELEIVPSPLMDDEHVGSRIRLREDAEEEDEDEAALQRQMYLVPCFHGGGDDMLFWEGFDAFNRDKIKVLSLKDKLLRELKCSRENSGYPCQKCYYTADRRSARFPGAQAGRETHINVKHKASHT